MEHRSNSQNAIHILGISGSLRKGSVNTRLLRAAGQTSTSDISFDILEDLHLIPAFNEDLEDPVPEPVVALRNAIASADAILIATPEYNSSMPGQLKNALDWLSRPRGSSVISGKPVAVVGASPSPYGAQRAQADTRKVLAAMGCRVLEEGVSVGKAFQAFTDDGRLADQDSAKSLSKLLSTLADQTRESLAA